MSQNINVVILAAGKGSRMKSSLPKVLHQVAGKSLLQHNLDLASSLNSSNINVVVGHGADEVKAQVSNEKVKICLQAEQLGTGHAVAQALPYLDTKAIALILSGDVPLLKAETAKGLFSNTDPNTMSVLTCIMEDPTGLGRMLRDQNGKLIAIVEEKDANAEQKRIREINTGIMAIPVEKLTKWLPALSANNAQGEYYLTDVIAMAVSDGVNINTAVCDDPVEVTGVNDRKQLAGLERHYQMQQAEQFMAQGVTLLDPARVDFRGDITIAEDVTIDVNVIFEGKVTLGTGVKIGPNCVIKNCEIKEATTIEAFSHLEDAVIGKACSIGPFARIRPGTELEEGAKIGNFVETKKAKIGKGSKINHLSYVGDSELGDNVNVGAGTITCNYDGVNKFKTIIGDNVFVGSNTALVAPVIVASGATIGAGSTITKDIDKDQLALSRSEQRNLDGWLRPKKS